MVLSESNGYFQLSNNYFDGLVQWGGRAMVQ